MTIYSIQGVRTESCAFWILIKCINIESILWLPQFVELGNAFSLSLFFFQIYLFFNWRIIALRNSVVLCQTSAWTRHRYTYVPSLWNLPPVSFPITPSAAAAAVSLQSCPTLCDPIDGSPPGSPVPGILQARTLEWVAISPSPMHESEKWKWSHSVVPSRLMQSPCLSSLRRTSNSHWVSILHMVM